MLERLTIDDFAGRLAERFRIVVDETTQLEATLVEAEANESSAPATDEGRTPFAIVFLGPSSPVLPQRIYRFEHDAMGVFEIFIVPIGRDADGVRYEAIFT
jgi:hypothetical protein